MKRIAKFDKVSYEQFKKDISAIRIITEEQLRDMYDNVIKLPTRSTSGSAGYDYVCPFEVSLEPNATVLIPTGIRCSMKKGYVHEIYPRSGLGFKYQLGVANTVGIIDSDYFFSDNEGHIMIKLVNRGDKTVKINAGDKFVQGIFKEYGITVDDDVKTIRNGGMGSTGK